MIALVGEGASLLLSSSTGGRSSCGEHSFLRKFRLQEMPSRVLYDCTAEAPSFASRSADSWFMRRTMSLTDAAFFGVRVSERG